MTCWMNTGIEIVPPSRAPSDGGQAFFHVTPALGQKLDLLHHLLETSDRVPLIEGPDGIGKSRLLQQLVVTAAPHWRLCAVEANPMLQPDQLLSTLARCFEVETGGSELEQRLLARFDELQQEGWLPVVSIDDAQLLPLESLALLLRLHAARADVARPFGLVLAATPAVHELLQALPGVGDQALQVMELVPMPVEQVKRMVAMFLRRQGSPALSDHRLQRLALESGGLPGEALKRAAATCARETGARSDPEEKAELRLPSVLSWPMLLGAGLLVTVITLLLVFQDAINALFIGAPAPQGEMLQLPPRERVIPLQRDSAPAVAHVSPGESPP
ncbi:MAG TPA: ATP-binding protein, partial [Sedimenticola sp.]|nr:ATP-binding protein [Sedimenticola sp.]